MKLTASRWEFDIFGHASGEYHLNEGDSKSIAFQHGKWRVRTLEESQDHPMRESNTGDGPEMFGPIQTLKRITDPSE